MTRWRSDFRLASLPAMPLFSRNDFSYYEASDIEVLTCGHLKRLMQESDLRSEQQ